ncbi:unnamed protein product, partial [Phaeothamnion confervicola]
MMFDYFKKRAEEGVKQAQNLATKAKEGKLGEALQDAGQYVKTSIAKFTDGLSRSRERLIGDLNNLLGMKGQLDDTLESLEELLMAADIGAATTSQILGDLREMAAASSEPLESDDVRCVLRGTLVEVLARAGDQPTAAASDKTIAAARSAANDGSASAIRFAPPDTGPTVLFVMGSNGMGKTTTIGKIAYRLRNEGGLRVLVAAADTFRAAAVEQLAEWAERSGADMVAPLDANEKASAVVFRACERAVADAFDVLIVDTSGRLSNNRNLNEELKKMKRVISEQIPDAPHETLLVVDAAVGRNAVDQARTWKAEVGVTGLVVTKLDGTARGGFVVSVSRDLGIPVKLIGVGEGLDDLRDFDAPLFVDSLLGIAPADAAALRQRWEDSPVMRERVEDQLRRKEAAA